MVSAALQGAGVALGPQGSPAISEVPKDSLPNWQSL